VKALEAKFKSTKDLALQEQSAVNLASPEIISKLAEANKSYEEKLGFIFIVNATGKSAEEMLRLVFDRLKNTYHEELQVAMGEQHKITILRLKKLLSDADFNWMRNSQVTTHVLDTSSGRPAHGIGIRMQQQLNSSTWQTMTQGITNHDGRIFDLLPGERILIPGVYKMVFESAEYFRKHQLQTFYPEIEVQFSVLDDQHYHVPLLLNPFGYSTYRGS
jgi:5-hydroxyisourate hydrolase/2-oxo-4-hydroxy-4-carboxy-5-ureidoimidazoline decarboxylase